MITLQRMLRTLVGVALAGAVFAAPAHAVTISIVNTDGAGEGFNDATPAAPVGGNSGTTIGQQRLIVFQTAANIWGGILPGTQTILVNAAFNTTLTCTATSAVLGSAGPISVFRDFPGAEFGGHWYNPALANQQAAIDLDGATADIQAQFNSNLGNVGCLTGVPFYYGLDNNEGTGVDLLAVVLHELGHGLGFMTVTNGSTGATIAGFPALWDKFLKDEVTGLHWDAETAAQRAASSISVDKLTWDGKAVTFMAPLTLSGAPRLNVASPPSVAGMYSAGTASFGPALTNAGVTGPVTLVNDGVGTTSDACEAFPAGSLAGQIAFIDRGTCAFTLKAKNAQDAGAIGAIIVNNVAGAAPGLGGTDATVTIPVISLSQADGTTLRTLTGPGMTATIQSDVTMLSGVNSTSKRVLLYAPNPFQGGSSVSHWDVSAVPNLLMEPAINGNLTTNVDLTRFLFEDIGWLLPRTTGVGTGAPAAVAAMHSAPNPFTATTAVQFALAHPGVVDLSVFDVNGRSVRRLAQAWMPAGNHRISWDGLDAAGQPVAAGVYLTRLKSADGVSSQRLVRVR